MRHGFIPQPSIPDLFVTRTDTTGTVVDAIVLELKATKRPGYLGEGLSQLHGYLGERPELFGQRPSGWLVAPPSSAFRSRDPDEDEEPWIVPADEVARRVVERLTP